MLNIFSITLHLLLFSLYLDLSSSYVPLSHPILISISSLFVSGLKNLFPTLLISHPSSFNSLSKRSIKSNIAHIISFANMHSLKFIFIMLLLISNTDAWRRRRRTKWFSIIPQDQNFQTYNILTPIVNRRRRRNKYYYELYSHISFLIVLYRGTFQPLYVIYFSLFYAYFFIFFILYFKKNFLFNSFKKPVSRSKK